MTIRPLSSKVTFVAPRNMTLERSGSPSFSHFFPLAATIESQPDYVNWKSEKFVAVQRLMFDRRRYLTSIARHRLSNQRLARKLIQWLRSRLACPAIRQAS